MKKFCLFVVMIFFCCISSAKALYITNYNGVTIEQGEYEMLSKIYSNTYVYTMNEETYNTIISKDLSKVKIIESSQPILPMSTSFSTTYKSIKIINNSGFISVLLTWKNDPLIRSYDVMGVRLTGLTLQGNVTFTSASVVDGKFVVSSSGTYKNFSNGFGISFKLSNGTSLESSMTFKVSGKGTAYATYQHAVKSVSLSDSTSYSISNSGLGNVLYFPSDISSKYDGMAGVNIPVN